MNKQDPNEIGVITEAKTEDALINLIDSQKQGNNKRASSIPEIVGYKHAEKNSPLDRAHIDFIVFLSSKLGELRVNIQVKSSDRKARKFRRKYPEYRDLIALIVVRLGDSIEMVKTKLISVLKQAENTARHNVERGIHELRERMREKAAQNFRHPKNPKNWDRQNPRMFDPVTKLPPAFRFTRRGQRIQRCMAAFPA